MKSCITTLSCLAFINMLFAQDTLKVFTINDLFYYIDAYHPVAKQSKLVVEKSKRGIQRSKGSLDPMLYSNLDQKHFNDKDYYSLFSGGLQIPTWFGPDIKAGFEQASGEFLNPENVTPANGVWYAGVTVPLGQGLMIDERRAAIKKARILSDAAVISQQLMMNELYYNASMQYWSWVGAYNEMLIHTKALSLASERLDGVRQNFLAGDAPAIDTLEAFIAVQNRIASLEGAKLGYIKESLLLSSFIWYENNTPLEITGKLRPLLIPEIGQIASLRPDSINSDVTAILSNHPELQLYDYKLKSLNIERSWNAEKLKPKLNVNYNFLSEGNTEAMMILPGNNYKWGVNISIPLFLRESRNELAMTRISIDETKLDSAMKAMEVRNKVKAYYSELATLRTQEKLFSDAADNYGKLLEGEKQKFISGESSMFLINSREGAYIQAELKVLEIKVGYQQAISKINFASASWPLNK